MNVSERDTPKFVSGAQVGVLCATVQFDRISKGGTR